MIYIRECLYDVEWQKLRCLMLGKWSSKDGIKQALKMCNGYWEPPSETGKAERVWRVLNLLNAVKLGWAQNPKAAPPDEGGAVAMATTLELSSKLTILHSKLVGTMATEWDWNKVRKDLQFIDPRALRAITSNLNKRVASARYRKHEEDNVGVERRRPELMFFLGLLNFELNRRNKVPNRCLIKITEKTSPYMQEFRGYRVAVAVPNMAGRKPFSSERAPSFDKPYHVVSYGDFETETALLDAKPRIEKELQNMGFSTLVWLSNRADEEVDEQAA